MSFQPLLPAGINDMSKDLLVNHFVTPFINPSKRISLLDRFTVLLEKVETIGIPFEVWIDGSFVTNKEEPNDIDIAFFFNPLHANALSPDKILILNEVADNPLTKLRYNCDVYFMPNDNLNNRSYWRGWFGFTRDETAKGFVRINI